MEEQNNNSHCNNGIGSGDHRHVDQSSQGNSAVVRRRAQDDSTSVVASESQDMLGPATSRATPADANAGPSFWRTLRYKWTIFLVTSLIAAPAIAVVWRFSYPLYRAAGQIRVRPIIPHLVFRTEDNGMIPYYKGYLNTQVAVILSPTVLQRALGRAQLKATSWYSQPSVSLLPDSRSHLEVLQDELTVRPRPMTEVIDIYIETPNSNDSAVIVNAVLDEYIKYANEMTDEGSNKLYGRLVKQYNSIKRQVRQQEKNIVKLQRKLGASDPQQLLAHKRIRLDETEAQLEKISRAHELAKWRLGLIKKRAELIAQQNKDATRDSAGFAVSSFGNDAEWRRLRRTVEEAQFEIERQAHRLGELHPTRIDLVKAKEFAEKLLGNRERQLGAAWQLGEVLEDSAVRAEPIRELKTVEIEVKLSAHQKTLLNKDIQKQQVAWKRMFDQVQILEDGQADLAEVEEVYVAVQNRLERKSMERNVPGSIEVLARAVAPQSVTKDRRFALASLTLLIALAAGFGVAYLRVGREEPIVQMNELNYHIPTPFLGRLPIVPVKSKRMPLGNPDLAEGIRMLRTTVLQRIEDGRGNVVLITSAVSGEGKTTVSILLARSLAMCGKQVLLVDADLRNPSLSKALGLRTQRGFLKGLADGCDDNEVIVQTVTPGLQIAPGSLDYGDLNSELIANGVFSAAMGRWQKKYDVVVLDSSPVLLGADAQIIAHQAAGTILIARAEHTRRDDFREALSYLTSSGSNLWGTVFMGPVPRRYTSHAYQKQV